MLSIIMTIINIGSLILIAIGYFREHYTIVDLETWNEICHFYNENHTDDGEAASCNVGFFWDYVSDIEEEPDEEEGQ